MRRGEWQRLVNHVYYHIGARFFPKITWITNRTTWEYNENIPPREKGGLIVVANHKYLLDPFFASMAFTGPHVYREIRWVSKIENFRNPYVKSIVYPFGTIPLSPERTLTERTIREIKHALKRGIVVGMFPEGGRTKKDVIRPFKTGAARMVVQNKVGYIPTALLGSRALTKGKAHIRVGKPVYLQDGLDPNDKVVMQKIADDMHDQVLALYFNKPQPTARYQKKPNPYNPLPIGSITSYNIQNRGVIAQKNSPLLISREISAPETYSYHDNEKRIIWKNMFRVEEFAKH
jgi:1-acyl-sn-glycerol-3-phosphate acyltransferase